MSFINKFHSVFNDKKAVKIIELLLDYSMRDKRSINYFGVNYTSEDLVSAKFYFSFYEFVPDNIINSLNFTTKSKKLIHDYWNPVKNYDYADKGLTIGFKYFFNQNKGDIRPYFHFRTEKHPYVEPNNIGFKLPESELIKPIGVCVEREKQMDHLRFDYYLNDKTVLERLLFQFNLDKDLIDKIGGMHYTESNQYIKKILLWFNNTNDIHNFINRNNNQLIYDLNSYLFKNYNLYHYVPGLRYKGTTNAVYYVTKDCLYNELVKFESFRTFYKDFMKQKR